MSRYAPCSLVVTSRSSYLIQGADPNVQGSDSASSSAGDIRGFVPPQSLPTSASTALSDLSAQITRSNEEPEPAWQALNCKSVDGELTVLTHVNPKQGPTSGGNEVYLLVRNLPPTAILYARFGPFIVATVGGLIGSGPSSECTDNSF